MSQTVQRTNWWPLVGFLLLTNGIGALGSIATIQNVPTWYADLNKPPWTPPSWLFGPVWTTLYVLIAISGWLVWRREPRAMLPYWIQLALNAIWTPVFFGLHQVGWALGIIVALIAAIVWNIAVFRRVSPLAAWLLVPYLLWVVYATTLNWGILVRN